MSERLVSILYTIPNLVTAGSTLLLRDLALGLDRDRFAPSVLVSRRGGDLVDVFEAAGVPVVEHALDVPARPRATLLGRARRAGRALRDRLGRFDLWHSLHYLDDYTEPLVARGAGARAWVYSKKNRSWNRRSWWLRSLLARRIVALDRDMVGDFFSVPFLRGKVEVIPPGVDTERFSPGGPADPELRAWAGDAPLALCVAHLVPIKAHPTLLDAVARVPDLRLALAGRAHDAEHAAVLERQVADLGLGDRVRFLGPTGDVPALLRAADLFVLPSRPPGEGCPVAVLEALAAGRPTVVTDVAGSRGTVGHGEGGTDREGGLVVPPEDPEALAEALARLAADPELRRRLGEAARRRALEHYTIERMVQAHERLYLDALGDAPAD